MRTHVLDPAGGAGTSVTHALEGHDMDTNEPAIPGEPLVSDGFML